MDLHIAGPVLLWCHEGTALVTHSTTTAQLIAGDVYYSPESVTVEENGLVIPLLFPDVRISGSARRVHVGVRWSDVIVHEFSRSLGLSIPAMRPSPALLRIFDDPVALPPVAQTPEAHAVSCAIADNPADQTGLEEFAQRHGISSRTLQRQFVNGTGFTFSEWRTAYRVHAASELLSLGFSVAVVANMVGFAATSSLTRAFRRHTGCAPSKYSLGMTGMGATGEVPRIPGCTVQAPKETMSMWVYKGTATFTDGDFCRFMGAGESVTIVKDSDAQLEVAAQSIALPVAYDGVMPDHPGLKDVVTWCRARYELVRILNEKVK